VLECKKSLEDKPKSYLVNDSFTWNTYIEHCRNSKLENNGQKIWKDVKDNAAQTHFVKDINMFTRQLNFGVHL